MHSSSWFLVAVATSAATHSAPRVTSAVATSTSQCTSVDTCYQGGAPATPCTVSNGGCPPCVTFADHGCFVKVNDACPFGIDCASAWSGVASSSTTSSAAPTTSSASSKSSATTTTTTASDSPSNSSEKTSSETTTSPVAPDAETPSKSTSSMSGMTSKVSGSIVPSTSGNNETSTVVATSSGSDMSVVFAIIGAAIGVIAVAVIFLTLVRRSNAAHDEEEDDMTPPTFSKGAMVQPPRSATGATMYSSYNGSNPTHGMSSNAGVENGLEASKGVSMSAVNYYNQQPPPTSAAPSSGVAGRAIPSQPVGMNAGPGMARAYGSSQNFGASGVGASGVGVTNQAVPSAGQHLPKASPHTRRESYEF
ncbi:hypothetical protein PsorP6_017251 [Peronosclerospora sorghi]|uniref:Uncharacterized protein n=1 Tax=Peronosclerospora sorghi TaxID=230839 RepID=A0ACC0WPZ0_9STRA|nr:hypothetical protein PsorP6_017251 [Peronosclerospora sorghi]